MKIKNKSIKPIGFGDLNVLPGKTENVPDGYSEAVAFYAKLGYVEIVKAGKDGEKAGGKARAKSDNSAAAKDGAEAGADIPGED